jgi:hypothetical protein
VLLPLVSIVCTAVVASPGQANAMSDQVLILGSTVSGGTSSIEAQEVNY